MTADRPALGPIAVGDTVIVTEYMYRDTRKVTCTVTKAARVWIELEEADSRDQWPRRYRMRRDSQNTGSDYSRQDYFRTPEQEEWDVRLADADSYLRAQGIGIHSASPWRFPARRIRLAEILRAEIVAEEA